MTVRSPGGSASRLRILHCIGSLQIGGEQSYLAQIAGRVDPERFDQTVAYTSAGEEASVGLPGHVRTVCVRERTPGATALSDWRGIAAYMALVRRESPDVLTTHSPGLWHLAASTAARLLGTPVVHTIQRPYGNRAFTEDLTIRVPPIRAFSYAMPTRFVALGSYYADDQIRRWRIPAERIALNYIGIDLDAHRVDERLRAEGRRELGLTHDVAVLGVVARLVPVKGVDRALRVLAALVVRLPDVRLVIVGGGPSEPVLRRMAEDLGLADRVIFTGPRTDTPKLLNAFDAFIQTTHNPLNGISSIEAMAAGKPILTVTRRREDEAMAADTCVDEQNGLFLRIHEIDVTVDRLAETLRDSEKLAAMGRSSRRLAEQRFDIRRHVAVLEQLYTLLATGAVA